MSFLADLEDLQNLPGVSGSDDLLQQLLDAADAAVLRFCKRDSFERQTYVSYFDGNGLPALVLPNGPVVVDDDNELSVWLDARGAYGDGEDAFPTSSLLTIGTDFVLRRDGADGKSVSGILFRLGGSAGGVTLTSETGWFPSDAYGPPRGLSRRRRPCWEPGYGNVKVSYVAGYRADQVPEDLTMAVVQLAAHLLLTSPWGGATPQSEGLGPYSYSLQAQQALQGAPLLGSTRQLLAAYRRQPL